MDDHEAGFLDSFVVPSKRDRFRGFLSDSRRRQKFLLELYHFRYLNMAKAEELDLHPATVAAIMARMTALGGPQTAFVMSTDHRIDGQSWPLHEMLGRFAMDDDHGSIASCIAGRLAIYNGSGPNEVYLLLAGK